MKTRIVLLSVMSSFLACSTFAQSVETDDMYFNAKDRAKLNAQKPAQVEYVAPQSTTNMYGNTEEVYASAANYNSRNVNPEYVSRANAQTAQTDNADYFVANYQYNNSPVGQANSYNQWNNNLNSWYNNPLYSSAYMGSAINSWNSPYYGCSGAYNSPWYNPFYANNGFSSSFSFYFGNSYNYGWGGSYGYQPYCGSSIGFSYSSGAGYNNYGGGYNNYYNYGYYNSPNVIIVNNGETGRGVTYGKRPTQNGGVVSGQANNGRTRSNIVAANNNGGRTYTGGRTSSAPTQQSAYYNRSWRMAQNYSNSSNTSNNHWNSGNSQQNNSFDNSRSNSSSQTRSSSFDSGGGSRTQSSSGSGSNGRTRGH